MSRTRLKLLAAFAAGVLAVALAQTWAARSWVERRDLAQARALLEREALWVAELLADRSFDPAHITELAGLAHDAAERTRARVSLIARDGTLLADSHVSLVQLERAEDHAARPEVRAALAGRTGFHARRSSTVGGQWLYLAVPHPDGAVRLARDRASLAGPLSELLGRLVWTGLVGSALAGLGLWLVTTRLWSAPLAQLRATLESLARGELDARVHLRAGGELGQVAGAVNRVGEQLELRLREISNEKEQLQAVLGGMVEGVLVLDSQGRIALANPRLRELFELRGELLGKRPIEAIRNAAIEVALAEAARSGAPVVRETAFGVGERRVLRVHAAGFASGAGRGVVAVFHDISDTRHLEAVRRDFVSNASHELKTPLTAIRGFAETLLSGGVPPEDSARYLGIILRHAERLSLLVEGLLELSRAESGQLALERMRLDVVEVARAVLQGLEGRLRERSLDASLSESGAAPALADHTALVQILENLLDNAIKYTPPGGKIELRVSADPHWVHVSVSDTGIGIPESHRARIFERFYRVDTARSRALGGTGLGLAIAKHLVQDLGGQISVESAPGAGSTFRFTLPRA
jgi:two-component system phosphate regulon sensor histidine kinase PhoR